MLRSSLNAAGDSIGVNGRLSFQQGLCNCQLNNFIDESGEKRPILIANHKITTPKILNSRQ